MVNYNAFIQSGAIFTTKNNTLTIGWGPLKQKKYTELNPHQPAFYFPDFFLQSTCPWLQFENSSEVSLEELNSILQDPSTPTFKWNSPNRKLFYSTFDELQSLFAKDQLHKAVPYAFTECNSRFTPDHLAYSLKNAISHLSKYPNCYAYGFWNNGEGILGITPEILFEHTNNHLHTMALAGTSPKNCTSPKLLREHQIVVEGITQTMQNFGHVEIGKMEILELPTMKHLKTPIQINLKSPFDFEAITHALHPTPALGAYPRETGWSWLHHCNTLINRGRYGAPVGLIDPCRNINKAYVGIRNMQWDQQKMRIGAGCGVIKESRCNEEWQEIKLKMESIHRMLGI